MKTKKNKSVFKKQIQSGLCVVAFSGLVLTGCSEDKSASQQKEVSESALVVSEMVAAEVEVTAPKTAVTTVTEAVEEKLDTVVEKVEEVVIPEPVVEAKPEVVAEPEVEKVTLAAKSTDDLLQYVVECPEGAASAKACKVDKNTYVGWRTYSVSCQVCHGGSGLGSTFAPNLMDRFNKQGVDYARFREVVTNGFTGQMGAMPAWKKNRAVMKDLDNLYRYLQARADDKLPKGRPTRMK